MKKLLLALFIITSCSDDYMTIEQRIIDSESKVPLYFYASAEQAGINTWRPVFTYYVYTVDEGEYDAYFHAYMIDSSSNVVWSGVQPLKIEGGKKVWGQYVTDAEFYPDIIPNVTPMAYVSVEY
tara:strand:+ start:603 stop:974 length:372 start_codon:yes stop_codon:yes gene_type:complete